MVRVAFAYQWKSYVCSSEEEAKAVLQKYRDKYYLAPEPWTQIFFQEDHGWIVDIQYAPRQGRYRAPW